MPKVSIIVPAYNAACYIGKTIDSILAQTFADFECIIIDDGSTDETLSVVSEYADSRIKVISQRNSGGPAKPRNCGIAAASGEYIAMFDSDDLMRTNKLQLSLSAFTANKNIDVIFSDFSLIDEGDNVIKDRFLEEYTSFRQHMGRVDSELYVFDMKIFFSEIIKANFIGTSSVVFKKSLIKDDTLFDESFSSGDDKLAWAILAKNSQFAFLDKVLHSYRKREGSISSKNVEKLLQNKIKILGKIDSLLNDEILHKEVIRKANEYYNSLGYLYRKSHRFSDAKKSYCKIRGLNNKPAVLIKMLKVLIEKIQFYWRR